MVDLDERWVRNDHEDGELLHAELPGNIVRMFRTMWEHTCLDLDLKTGVVVQRDQGGEQNHDPVTWPAIVLQIRRTAKSWQVLVPSPALEEWKGECQTQVEQAVEFQARYPGTMLTDEVEEARRRLADAQGLAPGWVNLAEDVGNLLERYLADSHSNAF
jgi:hypothetical protein